MNSEILKFKDLTDPGFYWHRVDYFRPWIVIEVKTIHGGLSIAQATWISKDGDFVGPIVPPSIPSYYEMREKQASVEVKK
jgi:hypothetical protein